MPTTRTILGKRPGNLPELASAATGSEFESEMVRTSLSNINGLRFLDSQTLSAILRKSAIDHGAAIEAFPGIKHEKEIGEPLQRHRPLTLWTFHLSLLRWLRSLLLMNVSKGRATVPPFGKSTIEWVRISTCITTSKTLTVLRSVVRQKIDVHAINTQAFILNILFTLRDLEQH